MQIHVTLYSLPVQVQGESLCHFQGVLYIKHSDVLLTMRGEYW